MQQEVPADASSLIYLAKADAFDEAARVARPILASPSVWREAVTAGEEVGAPEVPRIRLAEEQDLLKRVELADPERLRAARIAAHHRLGAGESEVLAIASITRWAIVDEGRATRVARSLGVTPVSTLFLAIAGYEAGDLDQSQALELLRRLAAVIGARSDVTLALENELRRRTR